MNETQRQLEQDLKRLQEQRAHKKPTTFIVLYILFYLGAFITFIWTSHYHLGENTPDALVRAKTAYTAAASLLTIFAILFIIDNYEEFLHDAKNWLFKRYLKYVPKHLRYPLICSIILFPFIFLPIFTVVGIIRTIINLTRITTKQINQIFTDIKTFTQN